MQAAVLGVISERTGYPVEMIELDLDLEADLSVDSIKRAEVAGEVVDRLGLSSNGADAGAGRAGQGPDRRWPWCRGSRPASPRPPTPKAAAPTRRAEPETARPRRPTRRSALQPARRRSAVAPQRLIPGSNLPRAEPGSAADTVAGVTCP